MVLFKGGGVRTLDVLLEAPQQEIENIISDEVTKYVTQLYEVCFLLRRIDDDESCSLFSGSKREI